MGKIEAALQRAKQLQRDGLGQSAVRRRATDLGIPSEPTSPAVWNDVRRVQLDEACLFRNHITLGLSENNSAQMAYNMLRTRLIRRMRNNGWSSVIVTSPNAGAGKSVTAINLALSVAREQNQTAYLIDLDLREPSIHTYLGVADAGEGLSAYLRGHSSITNVFVDAGIPRLYFALNTVAHQHSAELLTTPRMLEFIDEMKQADPSGIVIYDMPPVLVTDDVLAFLPFTDSLLLVAAQGETKRDDLTKSIALLEDANLLGVVLNKAIDFEKTNVYY